ncbi:GNAT family N-acetyltransferase [Mesorhizobium humile]|uniref:GNAT family N-acetyltransferase n=1 Tax=Mesorhizobium humile TaxID=3072313 RepID=A0ABU4YSN0_9HYPH|nr:MULTISPECIES: GNAT family N-acetyltransferase [unclassified Mesorhizobium]MDX8462963.1 GNAT family N-acetyltransferase [Mesorhizobium sp. VK2D]MDX8489323.1 GNAT family N-acetyltransferase [Mesorhizobium sp. VK2B]
MDGVVRLDAVNIRAAQAGDAGPVANIEATAFKTDWLGRERLEHIVSMQNGDVLVAEMDNRIVAFCLIQFRQRKPSANLRTIAVLPKMGGKGLGTALLNAAEGEAARRGYRLLRLEVRADNHRAIGFYQRAGFRRIGRKPNYYADGIAAIRMHKRIAGRELWLPGRVLERAVFAIIGMLRRQPRKPKL